MLDFSSLAKAVKVFSALPGFLRDAKTLLARLRKVKP